MVWIAEIIALCPMYLVLRRNVLKSDYRQITVFR